MEILGLALLLIVTAVLAPRYGVDSRESPARDWHDPDPAGGLRRDGA